ncbi:hypothetical protein ccbrp13_57670 [Ktedonobacteria bacterium brp13]|nr:hypothetical protein ccbrp13_57670 [Ktedonobacteria bacterium brp13]
MPKKSPAARAVQRQKQKSFELVRPATESAADDITYTETDIDAPTPDTQTSAVSATTTETTPEPVRKTAEKKVATPAAATTAVAELPITPSSASGPTTKTSASARLAARRQSSQRAQQQRNASAMVTAEHFAYVKRDLTLIGVLAVLFITTIIVLYFVLL